MTGFLAELGKSVADKWLSLLVLPGAVYLGALLTARTLGQAHALDASLLAHRVTVWARDPAATTIGGQVVLLAAALASSAAIGLAASSMGSLIERIALAADWRSWPGFLRAVANRRTESRRSRWDDRHRRFSDLAGSAARAEAVGRPYNSSLWYAAHSARSAIALEPPDRPTWSGDRIQAVSTRLHRDHHLELRLLWPYLWLVLPDNERSEVAKAREAITRSTVLASWAVLYAPLTYLWWPAALIAVLLGVTARRRTRSAADTYARILEASVRLHTGELAQRLGIEYTGTLPADAGDRLRNLLDSAPPPQPDVTSS